jgi:anthranilate phosphoribosyltransferase
MLAELSSQLKLGTPLSGEQVGEAIRALTSDAVTPEAKADFLTGLAQKGETVEEIAAFATELRQLSILPDLDATTRAGEILDVCGTGGDRLNTFNISTTVAIVVAAAGVKVAKHGNRAITSQSGSADVLDALGIRTDLEPTQAARSLQDHGFAFFFAPKYHPAFKHIGPARKLCAERGQRTIFNFLGPLLNPARPTAQLIGVPRPELCEPMARVLQLLGVRRGMVVCGTMTMESRPPGPMAASGNGAAFLDEISTFGNTRVAEFYQEHGFHVADMCPTPFPVQPGDIGDLVGGDSAANAAILKNILGGEEHGPKRDATLLNAAAALFVANRVKSIVEGWDLAVNLIESGRAAAKLQELVAFR